ncbi:MAG: penicillin-binding protein 2 [Anaerolineae bacterium]|nr:penicillin-binding protein 2 [Anaerolineae bacterium]
METLNRRISLVLFSLAVPAAILIGQLMSFQFRLNPSINDFERTTSEREAVIQTIAANRGQIYDREGVVLAVNSFQYRVGVSPALVLDRREAATELARLLDLDESELYRQFQPNLDGRYTPYLQIAGPVDNRTAQAVEDLDLNGVVIEPVALRRYPQGDLFSQLLGFVNYSERGFFGIEGQYDATLAGTSRQVEAANSPFNIDEVPDARDGQDLILTVDRDVQFVVEDVLHNAILEQQARGGTIIVMNPRTGEILGMMSRILDEAGTTTVLPNGSGDVAYNPAVGEIYEPGSVIKVVTAAIALQASLPGLDLNWTYNNQGCFVQGGVQICDWDRVPKGAVDFRRCIIDSLNTCTATWYSLLGPSNVYPVLQEFGFGTPTGIDLEGEEGGILNLITDPTWSEANFLNISYGQGISSTALQMLNAVNAIANDGLLMQPHIVHARRDGEQIFEVTPNPVSRPISAEVANAVTEIMVQTLRPGTLDAVADVEGYTIAGKTGTSQQIVGGALLQHRVLGVFYWLPARR